MLFELLLAVSVGLIAYAFYKWATLYDDYFAKRNFPFKKSTFLFGSSYEMFFGGYTAPEYAQLLYNSFPNDKMYGMLQMRQRTVVVRDTDLVKQLTVKEFDHFEDHGAFADPELDDMFGSSLFMLKGQRWRDMRATLSPAFTGSKMRQMFGLVTEYADGVTKHLVKQSTGGKRIDLDMNDFFVRISTDVIATCAFGIRINSIEDPKNEFFITAKKLNLGGLSSIIRFLFCRAMPLLAKKLNIQFIPTSISKFFSKMVIDTMNERKKRNIFRPDMINMLMQVRQGKLIEDSTAEQGENAEGESAGLATAEESDIGKKTSLRQWTDKELISQCFLFFLAGFDSTSGLLTFLIYELCVNPEIQQKLYEEISEIDRKLDGKPIAYNDLKELKYLDQVVSESLRKWPITHLIDRLCVKDYVCKYDENAEFRFEKDVVLFLPIYAFHHDPNFFPDPEKFDPERFSDENKHNIKSGTYLPFGTGPRNCIGSRFALMVIKTTIYYTLLNFSLEPNVKSQIPIRMKKSAISFETENGFHMDLVPREQPKSEEELL